MEKFLSIPVLDANGVNSQEQLVSITGIRNIGQATTTTVVISYLGGNVTTLTWPDAYASPLLSLTIESAVVEALSTGWTNVSAFLLPKGATQTATFRNPVTGVSSGGVIVKPLSAIAIA
tara:strand:+ start:1412 stop:1768 length:357 start_codon:yes stop_codon:yes gene_type:complete